MCFDRDNNRQITEYPLYLHEDEKGNSEIIGRKGRKVRRLEMGGGMPEGGVPYKQLVTDGEGKTVWEDRLAYESSIVIDWDANLENFETFSPADGIAFARVYDKAIGIDKWNKATAAIDGDENAPLYSKQVSENLIMVNEGIFAVLADGTMIEEFVFPKTGVYVIANMPPIRITIEETNKINSKYIPVTTFYLHEGKLYKTPDFEEKTTVADIEKAFGTGLVIRDQSANFWAKALSVLWDVASGCEIVYINPESGSVEYAYNSKSNGPM